jgi:hypothetical protein
MYARGTRAAIKSIKTGTKDTMRAASDRTKSLFSRSKPTETVQSGSCAKNAEQFCESRWGRFKEKAKHCVEVIKNGCRRMVGKDPKPTTRQQKKEATLLSSAAGNHVSDADAIVEEPHTQSTSRVEAGEPISASTETRRPAVTQQI